MSKLVLAETCYLFRAIVSVTPHANFKRVETRRSLPLHHALHGEIDTMSKLLRGLAAGYGAKKLGGGCFSTILIFIVLWWLLGNFDIFS